MKRIGDLRDGIATVSEASVVMASIAEVECQIALQMALTEKRIQALKAEHDRRIGPHKTEAERLGKRLKEFIEEHRELFRDPRKVKTESGSYGLQTVSEVVVTDEPLCIATVVNKEMLDCYKMSTALVKQGLKTRLESGQTVPGAMLKAGDTAVYKVAKSLIDDARAQAEKN